MTTRLSACLAAPNLVARLLPEQRHWRPTGDYGFTEADCRASLAGTPRA